jgi:hypothetical protein
MIRHTSTPSLLSRVRQRPWQVGGAFLIVWAALMLVMTGSGALTEWRYAKDGSDAQAIVTGKHLVRAEDDPQSASMTSYQVAYRFTSSQGGQVEGHDTVGAEAWERLGNGQLMAVQYLRTSPAVNRRAGHTRQTDVVMAGVSVLAGLAGTLLFLTGMRRTRAQAARAVASPVVAMPSRGRDTNDRQTRSKRAESPSLLALLVCPRTYFPVILMAFGGTFALTGGFPVFQEYQFRTAGRQVEGLVLSKGVAESYSAGARPPIGGGTSGMRTTGAGGISRTNWVSYRFTSSDGRTILGEDHVNGELWAQLREQGPVHVDYVAGRPGWNRVEGHTAGLTPLVIAVLGFLFTLGGAVLTVTGIRTGWITYRRLRLRTLVEARVTEVTGATADRSGPRWTVRYQFNDQAGQAHDGETVISDADADGVEVGTRGFVRRDAHQPDKMIWVGSR